MSTWIKVYFLVVMNLDKGLQVYYVSDYSSCSCYTFDGRLKPWSEGRQQCRTQGGDFVSMETVEEWKFIKTQIQNRTTEQRGENEWWIGLEERDGKWEWLTNHTLTFDKWQPGEPSNRGEIEKCVVIAKNYPVNTYGLLNNVECGVWRGCICEYKIRDINCNESQVRWCGKESRKEQETTKVPDQKSKTSVTTSTTIRQPTPKTDPEATKIAATSYFAKSATAIYPNVTAPSTRTSGDKEGTAASEYPMPTTTTQYKKDKQLSTTVKTDDVTTTVVSLSSKKPFPTLTIIITVLVVSVVVCLCCVVFCVCGWELKRKEKRETRPKHDETNTEHNTSYFTAGSSSGFHANEHELKAIVIQPNNACAQEDSHATTHRNVSDNGKDIKEVTDKESNQNKDPHGKSPQEHMDLTPDDAVGKENTKVSDIYATVDKTKKKNRTTEVVYAEVKKVDQRNDLVTYAELAEFNHDATRSAPKATPPYHPTEYASVSTTPTRCQTK